MSVRIPADREPIVEAWLN